MARTGRGLPQWAEFLIVGGVVLGGLLTVVSAVVAWKVATARTTNADSLSSTTSARKTRTRDEINDLWNNGKLSSTEDLQNTFGRPEKTREEHKHGRVSGYTINGKGQSVPLSGPVNVAAPTWTVTIYEYNRISVDAKGSKKVDSKTIFYIGEVIQPEFIP